MNTHGHELRHGGIIARVRRRLFKYHPVVGYLKMPNRQFRAGPEPKRLVQSVIRKQPLPEFDDPDGEAWILMRKILEQWASESTTPVLVVPIPVYQYTEQTASPRRCGRARRRRTDRRSCPRRALHA